MTKRRYHFHLPYHLSAVKVFYAIGQLQKEGIWDHIPRYLQRKIEHAKEMWHSVTITEDELNALDNVTWERIARKLGLEYD